MDASTPHDEPARAVPRATTFPDRIILVYGSDSGFGPMLLDVVKKAVGQEDCALCEITHHPLGKRNAWRACEARLGIPVSALHRNELPDTWKIPHAALPCILAQFRTDRPSVLVSRDEILKCGGEVSALERCLRAALTGHGGAQ
jgi:hypothetical protein